jgi:hypothetical protein
LPQAARPARPLPAAEGIHITADAPLGSLDRPAAIKAADEPVLLDNPVIIASASPPWTRTPVW